MGTDELADRFARRDEARSWRAVRRVPSIAGRSLVLAWRVSKGRLSAIAALQLVAGLTAAGVVLAGRGALGIILHSVEAHRRLPTVVPQLLPVFVIGAIRQLSSSVQTNQSALMGLRVSQRADSIVLEAAIAAELAAFETPEFFDALERADRGVDVISSMITGVLGIVANVVSIIGVGAALLVINPLMLGFVALACLPVWWFQQRSSADRYRTSMGLIQQDRRRRYVRSILTGRNEAKEVRSFELGPPLRHMYRSLYDEFVARRRAVQIRSAVREIAGNATTGALMGVVAAFVLELVLSGHMTLASGTAALYGIQQLRGRVTSGLGAMASVYEASLYVADYESFVAIAPVAEELSGRVEVPAFRRLVAEDVSFAYPGANTPALDRVNVTIEAGEVVALVGENGSGKTTLAKLLAALYRPSAGRVIWDDVDTAGIDPVAMRTHVAPIFQDFVRYELSAADNIGIGRAESMNDLDAIAAAASASGADQFLAALPDGYATILSKSLAAGTDLSVGQWQRVALARAFFRDAAFIILDEPTAALDARAEHDLFARIRELYRGRTVLLISHRFSSVRSADRIYVLDGGQVIEHGTHDQLMAAGGTYAELFTLQAAAYLDPVVAKLTAP